MSNKSYRIKYDENSSIDHLKIKLNQDFDLLEVLSLKITQEDAYKLHTSDYGILVGRVLANDGFGIPNAKVSLFIKNDNPIESNIENVIYPYTTVADKNYNNIRYNLLPSDKVKKCHQNVGTFPVKRRLLDNKSYIEVFDKYYKYTTVTNESGDYMIFGVPVGLQQVHVDIDLSDIGILSQTPRDMQYKGYSTTQFDSPNKFKKSTNLDYLSQIITENTTVYIYPFWGDESENDIAITKKNINIQYKFEPTCVFIGSIFSDSEKNGISKTCEPSKTGGKMSEMMTSQGSIEMIRKTIDGNIEPFDINGNRLINNDGVWCYQIPMNLDYVITDEYGNIKPSDNPLRGIPTRSDVRFRITLDNNGDDFIQTNTASYLVPNNPKNKEEEDYEFGSACRDNSFTTLLWNKVYSVKNYIPRVQKNKNSLINGRGKEAKNRNFLGIKSINYHESNNPTPYNNLYVNITLRFMIICILTKLFLTAARIINGVLGWIDRYVNIEIAQICIDTKMLGECDTIEDITDRTYYVPCYERTWDDHAEKTMRNQEEGSTFAFEGRDTFYGTKYYIKKIFSCIETTIASENEVVNFEFYNDWINGSLYAPRYMSKSTKNRKTGELTTSYCGTEEKYNNLYLTQTCAINIDPEFGIMDDNTNYLCNNKKRCFTKNTNKKLNSGNIYRGSNIYYKSVEFVDQQANELDKLDKYLHSTDLILLGSLLDCDQDGIPQLHQLLPSTTFKLPPNSVDREEYGEFRDILYYNLNYRRELYVATTMAELTGLTSEYKSSDNLYVVGELSEIQYTGLTADNNVDVNELSITVETETGNFYVYDDGNFIQTSDTKPIIKGIDDDGNYYLETTFTSGYTEQKRVWKVDESRYVPEMSGIDWGNAADNTDSRVHRENGLFLGVNCVDSDTYIKSCVNASRLCELGVDFDERYLVSNGLITIQKNVDGYITDDEISDGDARSMFSTLNINSLKTENVDGITKYKFDYNIPSSFDGRLRGDYIKDAKSVDYLKFKFGDRYDKTNFDNMFYLLNTSTNKEYSFPKYENSFYFYFGLKPGYTALDKFNTQYFVPCSEAKGNAFEIFLSEKEKESACQTSDGSIELVLKDIIYPCDVYINNEKVISKNFDERVTIDNLSSRYYLVKVVDVNENSVASSIFLTRMIGVSFDCKVTNPNAILSNNGAIRILNITNGNSSDNNYTYSVTGTTNNDSNVVISGNITNASSVTITGLTAGSYTVVINETNCSKNRMERSVKLISVDNADITRVSVKAGSVCGGGEIQAELTGILGDYRIYINIYDDLNGHTSNQWIKVDNNKIKEKTTDEFTLTGMPYGMYNIAIEYAETALNEFDEESSFVKAMYGVRFIPPSALTFDLIATECTEFTPSYNGTITIKNIINGPINDSYSYSVAAISPNLGDILIQGNFVGTELTITGLSPSTYFVRLYDAECIVNENNNYATVNGIGVKIGEDRVVTSSSITISGNKVTSIDINDSIEAVGLCYVSGASSSMETLYPLKDVNETIFYEGNVLLNTSFNMTINGLSKLTNYFVRIFAISHNGHIGYSELFSTTTDEGNAYVITLDIDDNDITTTSSIAKGRIQSMYNGDINSKGIILANTDMESPTKFKMRQITGLTINNFMDIDGNENLEVPIYGDAYIGLNEDIEYEIISENTMGNSYKFNSLELSGVTFSCNNKSSFKIGVTRSEVIATESWDRLGYRNNLEYSSNIQIAIMHHAFQKDIATIFDLRNNSDSNFYAYYPAGSNTGYVVLSGQSETIDIREPYEFIYELNLDKTELLFNQEVTLGSIGIYGVINNEYMDEGRKIESVDIIPMINNYTILEEGNEFINEEPYSWDDGTTFSVQLTGLKSGKTYSYRAFVISDVWLDINTKLYEDVISLGEVKYFTTKL